MLKMGKYKYTFVPLFCVLNLCHMFSIISTPCVGTHAAGTGLLFPHTQNNGDQLGPIGNDQSIERFFKVPFKYWGKLFNSVHVRNYFSSFCFIGILAWTSLYLAELP